MVKRYTKKYTKKTRPWYKKKYSVGQIAKKAFKTAMYMKGMINCEKKYHDYNVSTSTDWNGGPGVLCLTNMAQGNGDGTRDGNSILGRSIYLNWTCTKNSGLSTQNFRIIIYHSKQNVGGSAGILTPGSLLENIGSANVINSPLDRTINGRIKVLRDYKFNLSTGKGECNIKKEFIKIYLHPKFTGSSSADFDRDHIFIALFSDNDVATTLPLINFTTRFGYYDN